MIYHFKSLVLVRKGRAFYATLYQWFFFEIQGGVLEDDDAGRRRLRERPRPEDEEEDFVIAAG